MNTRAGVGIGLVTSMLLMALALAACWRVAEAQEKGDPAAGQRLAERWCSGPCHVIGPASARGTSTGVPTFAAIARMPSTTPMSLRVFLQTPHAGMPDLHLSRDEIDDLAAYILSLRR
jgi:mono/diheme cytochrome c family protein